MRDKEEITRLFQQHYRLVWNICYTFLRNVADVEDAVQDTFVRLALCDEEFKTPQNETAWLITAAKNVCRDELRKARRKDVPIDEAREAHCSVPEPDETLQAVRSLPEKYRSAIYLYYYEGYSTEELAGLLHRRQSTVRSDLRRGRLLLKQMLERRNQ